MAQLQKIIKVTQEQYNTLKSGGTVGSYSGIDPNYIYLVEDDGNNISNEVFAKTATIEGALTVWSEGDDFPGAEEIPTFNNDERFAHNNLDATYYSTGITVHDNDYDYYYNYAFPAKQGTFAVVDRDDEIITKKSISNVAKTLTVSSTLAPLEWNTTTEIGSIAGQKLYVKMPTQPTSSSNTTYQTHSTSDTNYTLLLGTASASSGKGSVYKNYNKLKANPKSGQITAASFYATSDKRLKENIKEFTPKHSILELPVVEFDFKSSGDHQIGCLAQDLQEICPEVVSTDSEGYLSINESKLVYLLLLEVKKLKEEVNELRGR